MNSVQVIARAPAPPKHYKETRDYTISQVSVDGRRVAFFRREPVNFLKRLQAKKKRDAYEATDKFKKRSASSKGDITKKRNELNERITFLESRRCSLVSERTALATQLQQVFGVCDISYFTNIAEFDRLLVDNQQMLTSARRALDQFNASHSA